MMINNNISVIDNGDGNQIIFVEKTPEYTKKAKIIFNGNNNKVVFGEDCTGKNLHLEINGSNNKFLVGKNSSISGEFFMKDSNNIISIRQFTTTVQIKIECEWGTRVDIGEDCMFSRDITIRTGDSHSIIDLKTNKRVNFPKSIFIGSHTWIGYGVNIAKGTEIQSNSVLGAASYVNKKFDIGNVIIAGVPARIVKNDITWDRRSLSDEIPQSHIENIKRKYLFK